MLGVVTGFGPPELGRYTAQRKLIMGIVTIIVSIATAAGLGGIIGAYFQARFNEKTQRSQQQQELKQKRYLCILILMLTKLSPKIGMPKIRVIRPDGTDRVDG